MFYKALAFNQNISNWDTSSVSYMSRMCYCASSFDQQLCWDLSSVSLSLGMNETFCGSQGSFMEGCTSNVIMNLSLNCPEQLFCGH